MHAVVVGFRAGGYAPVVPPVGLHAPVGHEVHLDIFIPARNAAYAAMLNISTITPPDNDSLPHLETQVKAGSFGYISPFIRYRQSFNGKLALTASGEYVYAENDYPFTLRNLTLVTREKRTNNMMNSGHGEVALSWRINEGQSLDGKIYYYENHCEPLEIDDVIRHLENK